MSPAPPLDPPGTLLRSPLDELHRAAGARLAPFGGWEMPLWFTGAVEEHRACRAHAALFDVSHLGALRVTGAPAVPLLQWTLTNDLGRIAPGRAQYSHLLDPGDGSVVDDVIVWWTEPEELLVLPNAANTARLRDALLSDDALVAAGGPFTLTDVTRRRALIALQGPAARRVLGDVFPEAAEVRRFHVARLTWRGRPCLVAGTGYTGEDGVELHVAAGGSDPGPAELWVALRDAGAVPAGLAARDTLRLEAGLPLHGHELGPGITPLEAGLGWVVAWGKGDFRGRAALAARRRPRRLLRGLLGATRRPLRDGAPVLRAGAEIGRVTSGNFSPNLGRGIALAFLPPDLPDGTDVEVMVRGQALPATVTRPPFVRPGGGS